MEQAQKSLLINHLLATQANQPLSPDMAKTLQKLRRKTIDQPAIFVGAGTCGLGAGARKTIAAVQDFLAGKNMTAEIIEVGCIGMCSAEPLMDVQLPGRTRVSFKHATGDKVPHLLDALFHDYVDPIEALGQFRSENGAKAWENIPFMDEHPYFERQVRVVLDNCGVINPVDIQEYIAHDGYKSLAQVLYNHAPLKICDLVEDSGLRGRGGGGFPTGRKWKFAHHAEGEQKYLICNADEGDPGAFMDRAVIEGDPHKLIEGMCIAAYAIGATKSYIYIRAEYPLAIERLEIALEQAREYGILGENILNSGFNFDIKIKKGAGAFVCGEETALIQSIEGRRGMPRPRPPYPAVKGLFGQPTIINNVETLANLPGIFRRGADWFASIGTENSKGTKVFALSGRSVHTGLIEIPMGTTIRDIIFTIGGGIKDNNKFKAVQMGGPSGGCVTEQNLDIPVDYQSLLEVGAMMGSGGMVVMDESTCMVDVAKFFMDFIQRESCGKCIPCREGTRRMLDILDSITKRPHDDRYHESIDRFKGVMMLEEIADVIKDTSLCGLGQSAPNPVLSTIRWFRDEYEEHVFERKCRANVCTELRTYVIDVEKCTGCMACVRKCPTNAIIGAKKTPHFILEEKCIGCGTCYDVCKFAAIYIKN